MIPELMKPTSLSVQKSCVSNVPRPGPTAINSEKLEAGFTLIELMIAVAIVAILAAIAIPAYSKSIVNSNRAAGEACLSSYGNYMERYYTTNLRYDQNTSGTAIALPALDCASTANTGNNYTYTLPSASLTQSTYTVQAAPIGSQATRDTQCGTLSLNQTGTRSVSGTGTVDTCWRH